MAFLFNQAEKVLDSQISSYDALATKAFTLFAVIVPILTVLVAYLATNPDSPFFVASVIYAGFLLASAVLCCLVFGVTDLVHSGREPLSFTQPETEAELDEIYDKESARYQTAIDDNRPKVESARDYLRWAMRLFVVGAVLSGLAMIASPRLHVVHRSLRDGSAVSGEHCRHGWSNRWRGGFSKQHLPCQAEAFNQ